jgi:hypothetical protein
MIFKNHFLAIFFLASVILGLQNCFADNAKANNDFFIGVISFSNGTIKALPNHTYEIKAIKPSSSQALLMSGNMSNPKKVSIVDYEALLSVWDKNSAARGINSSQLKPGHDNHKIPNGIFLYSNGKAPIVGDVVLTNYTSNGAIALRIAPRSKISKKTDLPKIGHTISFKKATFVLNTRWYSTGKTPDAVDFGNAVSGTTIVASLMNHDIKLAKLGIN